MSPTPPRRPRWRGAGASRSLLGGGAGDRCFQPRSGSRPQLRSGFSSSSNADLFIARSALMHRLPERQDRGREWRDLVDFCTSGSAGRLCHHPKRAQESGGGPRSISPCVLSRSRRTSPRVSALTRSFAGSLQGRPAGTVSLWAQAKTLVIDRRTVAVLGSGSDGIPSGRGTIRRQLVQRLVPWTITTRSLAPVIHRPACPSGGVGAAAAMHGFRAAHANTGDVNTRRLSVRRAESTDSDRPPWVRCMRRPLRTARPA